MKFGVIGRTSMLLNAVRHLTGIGHELAFIATAKASPEYTADASDFRVEAQSRRVPFHSTLALEQPAILRALQETGAEVVISVNWPKIFTADLVDAFPHKIINCHGSALPRYRGNACPNWAILNGDPEMGITFHVVEPSRLDSGPIIHQEFFPLEEDTYITDVYAWMQDAYPRGFAATLEKLSAPGFVPVLQDHSKATRAYPRRPEDDRLDFGAGTQRLLRLVRASSRPFSGAFCMFEGRALTRVWRASPWISPLVFYATPGQVMHWEDDRPVVATSDGAVRFDEWQAEADLDRSVRMRFS